MTLAARPGDEADADDGLVLVYDAWNRLTKVYDDNDADGEPDAGELLATYEYDGLRRRIVETIEGDPDVVRDSYYNEAWQVLEVRRDGDVDAQKQFIWDRRYVDSPIIRFHDANTDGDYDDVGDDVLYYIVDANFNVTAVVDTSGAVVERYAYDSYGKVTILDGTTGGQTDWATDADGLSDVDNRILYAGYHFDAETGLYLARNRIHHSTLGRWLQRDPMGYLDGMSLYEYVRSGPVNRLDPMGLSLITDWSPDAGSGYLGDMESILAGPNGMYGADVIAMPAVNPDLVSASTGTFEPLSPATQQDIANLERALQPGFDMGLVSPGPVFNTFEPRPVKRFGPSVGTILKEFFSPWGKPRLWVMQESDDYTRRVRNWQAVKNRVAAAKIHISANCEEWEGTHMTDPTWKPHMGVHADKEKGPNPPPTNSWLGEWDYRREILSRKGLDVPYSLYGHTGTVHLDLWDGINQYMGRVKNPKGGRSPYHAAMHLGLYATTLTLVETQSLHTEAIGSFFIFTTVDKIDCCISETATIRFWMWNSMDYESFEEVGQFLDFPGGPAMERQVMWWTWTEEYDLTKPPPPPPYTHPPSLNPYLPYLLGIPPYEFNPGL